jgi:hypothetical protein
MERDFQDGDAISSAFFVDAGLTYNGPAADHIVGLDHLAGVVAVDVLADGATHPQVPVAADGSIQLQRQCQTAQIGLPCPARLHTMRVEAGAASGTSQAKIKRINGINIRVQATIGGTVGSPDNQDILSFRQESDLMDQPVSLYSGDWPPGDRNFIPYPEGYEQTGIICYENDQPLPATILAFWPQLVTQG